MFGFWEAILSFLAKQVGLRNDSPDPAGSLHGKVRDVKKYLTNTIYPRLDYFRGKQPRFAAVRCPENAVTTVLNVTGAGFLTGIAFMPHGSETDARLKITIDGTVRYDGITPNYHFCTEGRQNSFSMFHRFNTALKIQVRTLHGSATVHVSYLLD